MKLIQIGKVGRPHGFRGEFLIPGTAATVGSWNKVTKLFISPTGGAQAPTPFAIERLTPMPKGMRVKLAPFNDASAVKAYSGRPIFLVSDELPDLATDEYYVGDLVGFEVFETDTRGALGHLLGVETVGHGCPDRWWIGTKERNFPVPATHDVIDKVETKKGIVWIRDARQYQKLQSTT